MGKAIPETKSAARSGLAASGRSRPGAKAAPPKVEPLERSDWLAAARRALILDGVAGVKVDRLAKTLNVTRGGFYWRFDGHADLMDALLVDWRRTNTTAVLAAIEGPGAPLDRFAAMMRVWIDERGFDPAYDLAIRDWARTSAKVARAVRKFDNDCIDALRRLFLDAGHDPEESVIRARIVYYHQVGYYALRVRESRARRYESAGLYMKILTGLATEAFSDVAGDA